MEDGVVAGELLRGDVDKLEALHGFVDADHREGAEDLHHRRAFACGVGQQYGNVRKGLRF